MHKPTLTLNNTIPALLAALCNHEECPQWLSDCVWDAVSDRAHNVTYSETWFTAQFEAMDTDEMAEDRNERYGLSLVQGGVQ